MLKKSLHEQIPIVLGLKTLPDAVALPSNLELFTDRSRQSLPPGTQIIELFDQIGKGIRTMLILGQPGAGKTIALLQLTQDLLDRAEKDVSERIPVVLNLSSWAQEKKPFTDWLVQEIHSLYGVAKSIGKAWVEQQELLLLLDGLDEIRNKGDREACVQAINIFQQQHSTEIVVCCRILDYKILKNQLRFSKAIYLKNLSRSQIETYLAQLGTQASGLKTLLAHDTELQKLARSPLMLNIMVLAYEGIAAKDIPELSPASTRTQQLFDAYIDRMFRGSKKHAHLVPQIQEKELYSRQKAKQWLIWLAEQMVDQSQTVFLIERLQPDLLERGDRVLYRVSVGLVIGSGFGLMTGLTLELRIGLITALITGLSYELIGWRTGKPSFSSKQIKLVEAFKWSWKQFRNQGLIVGLGIGMLGVLSTIQSKGLIVVLIGSLLLGLISVPIGGLIGGFIGVEVATRREPNQGIWRSARNSLISGLIGGLIGSPIFGLLFWTTNQLMRGLFFGLVFGLVAGLLEYGGLTCIQHFVLRCLLHHRGVIPWNYARFLNWASDKLFLQRVGGGYIFVHRRLMEHFAQMDR